MSRSRKAVVVILAIAAAGSVAALLLIHRRRLLIYFGPPQPVTLKGAVMVRSSDVDKELPISGVNVSAAGDLADGDTTSSATGYFALTLSPQVKAGRQILLHFRHPQFEPLDLTALADNRLYLIRMVPIPRPSPPETSLPHVVVSDIKIRYSIKTSELQSVGSIVKTFRVVNTSNVPCNGGSPCSPDGRWKAAVGSATLDAPGGNFLSNARVSCIAGPCPFTRIQIDRFSTGGPTISVTILDWSDTTTFLFEAEVVRSMTSDDVRFSYPVIFGQTLHFTVPAGAEGVCIEADVNRDHIVFPLGLQPRLSWASCTALVNPDQTTVYRCDLKPGYAFQ